MIIDLNDLNEKQQREIKKILRLDEATLPPVNKYELLRKYEQEQRAIRQARNNLGGKDGK